MTRPALTAGDLARPRRIHLIAISGTGMNAYAAVLASQGHRVTGSDLAPKPEIVERLRALGVTVRPGHSAENLPPDVEIVAASTAVPSTNPEAVEAVRRGITVLRRADLLAALAGMRPTLAVAGTHGKTTTTALLATALEGAGLHPSFVVGATVLGLDGGARWDPAGDLFAVEADESDGTFLELPRCAAIVTNVEADHLAHYGGASGLFAAFDRFAAETPGPLVVCADDPGAANLPAVLAARSRPVSTGLTVTTYGMTAASDARMLDVHERRDSVAFTLALPDRLGGVRVAVSLPVPGLHNARNAAGALTLAVAAGASPLRAGNALARFAGVARRFQHKGVAGGVAFIDDFAHLPGEVSQAIATAVVGGHRRVVAVFQPHRYSRTEELSADFAHAFDGADLLVVAGIYAAGEAPRAGITGRLVADAAAHAHMTYVERRDELAAHVCSLVRPGDLCLTIGAGDVADLADEVAALLGGAR